MIEEKYFECCYCGERISFLLDLSVDCQKSIEDCGVCCRPIEFSYTVEADALSSFEVFGLD